jgi:hypothetical protein
VGKIIEFDDENGEYKIDIFRGSIRIHAVSFSCSPCRLVPI